MATPKSKTNLACDTCRLRKSRCDGIRPTCSHCRTARRECTYRPTPTSLETDVSVLSRLAQVESRLQALEGGNRNATDRDGLVRPSLQGTQGPRITTIPDLHTASAQKMLHCWPRIRLNLTLPEMVSTTYLRESDAADKLLLETGHEAPQIPLREMSDAIVRFYDLAYFSTLPLLISELCNICTLLGHDAVLDSFPIESISSNSDLDEPSINLEGLTIPQLLVLSIVTASTMNDMVTDNAPVRTISAQAFTIALQKQWMLLSLPEEERVPLVLLTACCLVYFWARPFHALGLLQSIDPAIRGYSLKHPEHDLVRRFARIHFILESDILTEIDGFASKSCPSLLPDYPESSAFAAVSSEGQQAVDWGESLDRNAIENHTWLRCHLNRTLHLLYSPNKAYAQPHELADIVSSFAGDLSRWYRSRPLNQQFSRDTTTLSMYMPDMSLRLREIAIRYSSCVFLLHRPVLYFFLHKDMEYTVRPPDNRNLHSNQEPWILESCRDCIENAALIIHFTYGLWESGHNERLPYHNWIDLQLLFAAYLVLLQVKSVTSLFPIFRNIGDLEELLNRVEQMLEDSPVKSLKNDMNLAILRNERQNFNIATTPYSAGSV
ncbi:hypothetical protein B0J13DRAFT_68285 [Dactylonectria estremocensis]|uniref:Zn(2)-C6 fungal-type domain-containing protein n=1 Tax=Dactylonectria estremocensis TaxID=1079267 RepID=A0A9P9EMQ1_9HYPO|nr:hypothetical protein B0J13DRAFT_68285 [Dactylonectria estremocensis]